MRSTSVFGLALLAAFAPYSVAFQSIQTTARPPHLLTPSTDHGVPSAMNAALNGVQGDAEPAFDPDHHRRRQLLMSMLAGAVGGSTAALRPSAAVAEEGVTATSSATRNVFGFEDLIVPPLDDSDYLAYELGNGLRVLLCSDPSTNEAAAAMDVHAGACSDPTQVKGLAHFTEHMLFLGTKPYPEEDSFESFLSSNGGASNAFTDSLDTVYFFEMDVDSDLKFAEGLKRFGSFFTEPLFTETATGRELNAIDSENAKNLQTDSFRIFQMMKTRANSDHPFSKFFTGNKKTLLDETKEAGINLREELIKFYNQYYSANQMTLAVAGPQSIDELKTMVEKAFGDVPNKNRDKPEEAWKDVAPFETGKSVIPPFQAVVEVVPVKDVRQVSIAWPVVYKSDEDLQNALLDKPSNYVAHLLGHEGPGSLLSYLKRRGWATSVGSSNGEELSDFETFDIVVGLTRKGLGQVDKVVEAVYSYISMLRDRNIPNYVFDEVLQLEEIQWRFLTRNGVASYVQSLSTSMQRYPPPLYVAGPRRLALGEYTVDPPLTNEPRSSFPSRAQLEQNRRLVNDYLDCLTVDNGIVSVMSKSFEGKTDQKEKWYGTDYRIRTLSSSTLDNWRNCERPKKLKLDFPKPNVFIPSEEGLVVKITPPKNEEAKKRTFESKMRPIPPPTVIRDDGRWTVYFKQDDRFGKPKGYLIFQVMTKEVFANPTNAALANLLELCAADRLTEYAYDAQLAGLSYDIQVLARGVRLTFGGYNDKLKKFASYVSRKLSTDVDVLLPKNDNEFETYKDQVMRLLSSFDVKQPYAHASYYSSLATQPPRFQYDNSELRAATRAITLPDLLAYSRNLWSSGKGEALIQGNLEEREALDMVDSITGVLGFRPIPLSECPPRIQALPLPPSNKDAIPTVLLVAEPNPANENAVGQVAIQSLSPTEKDHVLVELISSVVREPFYNDLRTKQQLGYIVSSGIRGVGSSRTMNFIVQSSVAPADILSDKILTFLDEVETKILAKLNKGDLAVYVKSLIDRKTERDKELSTEVTRNWVEISSGRLEFDILQQEARALLDVEKEDLIDFWRKIYSGDGRRVLITQVIPGQGAASSTAPPRSTGYGTSEIADMETKVLGVDDVEQFRRDLSKLI